MQHRYGLKLDNIRRALNISQWYAQIALGISTWVLVGHILDMDWMYTTEYAGTSVGSALLLFIMSMMVMITPFRIKNKNVTCWPSMVILVWAVLILIFPELSSWFDNKLHELVGLYNNDDAATGFNTKVSILVLSIVFVLKPYGYTLLRAALALATTYIPIVTLFGYIDGHHNLINQMNIHTALIVLFLSWSLVFRQTHRPQLRPLLIDKKVVKLFTLATSIKSILPLALLALWTYIHPDQISSEVILSGVAFVYLVLLTTVYAMIRVSYITRDARRLARELHIQASIDELTQVSNRSGFMREHDHQKPLVGSIILCDIDHFKKINDTYGHAAGDEALKLFAKILKDNIRPEDQLIRWGGEEFLILTNTTRASDLEVLAERLRYNVENTPCLYNDLIIHMTASFGVRVMLPNEKLNHGIKYADKNLYFAKALGRNQVVIDDNDGFNKSLDELIDLHKRIYGHVMSRDQIIERFKIYDPVIVIEQLTRYRKLANIQVVLDTGKKRRAGDI